MDQIKIGRLIRGLRKEKQLTQRQLAEQMHISDKTVSKWERGLGCPDVSLLPALSELLRVDLETLLSGAPERNEASRGDMKKLRFYLCPTCGDLITATANAAISCCGKKLSALCPRKAEEDALSVEFSDHDFFITSEHPMEREHYIAFVALLTGDSILLRRQYPEWDLQVRIPVFAHGTLLWYCTKHGLFYREI